MVHGIVVPVRTGVRTKTDVGLKPVLVEVNQAVWA